MPRIPSAQIETIKRDVSCRSVLEAAGLEFQKHGPDVVCRCPFHDDRTPSLVVSERKNLWRCHGACGVGGDVINLAMRLRGISFRHAVELLAEVGAAVGAAAFAPGVAVVGHPVRQSTVRRLPCPLDAAADDARLLAQVVDFYAGRLTQPGNAGRAYLASRGLADAELIRRFAFGFADRSLGLRLPAKNRKEGEVLRGRLEALGLFRSSGHEHFAGSVVVPIHGGDGAVVGLYGRKVTEGLRPGTLRHTYLAGPHRGVWNDGPGLVQDGAVVVCEAILDAASCWVAGIRNVTAAYGVNGWTADHDRALAAQGARDVFVAFDADAAGDAAAATRCEALIAKGYTAYRVQFPPGQDANDVLRGAEGAEALRRAVRGAAWIGGAPRVVMPALPVAQAAAKEEATAAAGVEPAAESEPAPVAVASSFAAPAPAQVASPASVPPAAPTPTPLPGVSVQVAGEDVSVVIGTRTYRVRGLARNRTSDVLRVNLRLSVASAAAGAAASTAGERFHVDSLDLYQTRFRQAFIAAAAAETGLAADVVKADLGKLLLALECHQADERRRGSAAASPAGGSATSPAADPAATMPPEAREAALSFLSAPDLCQRIQADLDTCGLVGEATNKLVAYLAATSRKLDSPLAVVVQSSSAAGKSTLMDKVLSLMPPEEVRQYSAISGKSPFYLGTDNLKHRILAVAEEEGARRASYALKLLQSDGHLSMAATGKDPESGKLVTHDYRVEGPVMLMLTTTAIDVDPELMNRCLVLTVDEGASQTAAIQAAQRTSRTLEGLAAKRDRAGVVALHRNAQRLLRPLAVVNPLAPSLSFGSTQTRLRRDHAKYLALIDAVAFLHQYQRPLREHRFPDGTVLPYIEATAADVALAERLARVVLARSLDDLPPQTRRFLGQVHAWATTAAGSAGQALERFAFTRRQAREGTGLGQTQTRMHLDRLVEHELVEVLRPGGDGLAPRYRLAWEPTAAGDAAAPLGPPGAGPAVPPTPSTEESPHTPMMAACRGLSGVVGGMSESIPTGSMTVEYSACSENDGACRGAAVAQGRGFNSSGIVTYMHEPPAQPEPQAVAV